jgi:hypothetical protein
MKPSSLSPIGKKKVNITLLPRFPKKSGDNNYNQIIDDTIKKERKGQLM